LGVLATATYDTRDAHRFTRSGLFISTGGSFYPFVFDYGTPFGTMQASAAGYFTPAAVPQLTLALRASGRLTMGDPPVHEAAFIGGSSTVRGYESGRYAGESSAYFNGEARVQLATLPLVVPWRFGVVAIGDVGRVFNVTDDDNIWHGSAGGGIWFALPSRALGGVMTIVGSPQGTAIWFGTGFMF
jgi:outer membrane protein assembly factor BamA